MIQLISTNLTTVEFWQHKLNCTDVFKSNSIEDVQHLSKNTSKHNFLLDNYFVDSSTFSNSIKSKFNSFVVFESQVTSEVIDGLKEYSKKSKIN